MSFNVNLFGWCVLAGVYYIGVICGIIVRGVVR